MPYRVEAYSIELLKTLFSEYSEASREGIDARIHAQYFEEYFNTVGACTIVVEEQYIDHDYLEDFSAYYVKCFQPYRRECTRLHFFQGCFDTVAFAAHVDGTGDLTAEALQDQYLGFVVLKPLPASIIGRTCLTQYPDDGGRRRFPATREYEANLYGTPLRVETLAFQEQDSVTSACATSALWSALQATARLFQHHLPSPVEITKAATTNHPLRSRAFPNTDGLTVEQMAGAIRAVGLEPLHVQPANLFVLKAVVYGYLRAGIPPLLIHRLVGVRSGHQDHDFGLHAVAVTGYSLPPDRQGCGDFVSDSIDRFYVHDDQVGPFARMKPDVDGLDVRPEAEFIEKVLIDYFEPVQQHCVLSEERAQLRRFEADLRSRGVGTVDLVYEVDAGSDLYRIGSTTIPPSRVHHVHRDLTARVSG